MGHVHPSHNTAVNKSRKQVGSAPASFSSSSYSTASSFRRVPAGLKAPQSWSGHDYEENRDSYRRALGKLVAELGKARETERQKIANDLHDQIGQNLVLAIMKLGSLERSVAKRQLSRVHEIRQLISEVIGETRSLVFALHPPLLRDLGLQAALEWLVERTRVVYGLCCVAEIVSMPKSLPRDVAETLFQAVRELLINVAKHAGATQARVIFRGGDQSMMVQVMDDGQGFEPARISVLNLKRGGFGLLSMRERLALLGGNLDIDSAPGQGTKITITLPLATCGQA
jgi:signal transduction histidine kinase